MPLDSKSYFERSSTLKDTRPRPSADPRSARPPSSQILGEVDQPTRLPIPEPGVGLDADGVLDMGLGGDREVFRMTSGSVPQHPRPFYGPHRRRRHRPESLLEPSHV